MALIIGVVIVLLILFGFLCYKKAPPTEAIVVTGFGLARPKVVCGKGTFVLPVLQRADRLNMRLLKIDVKTPETGVKTQNGVSLWIDSVVTIQVYSENSTVLDEEVKASGLKDAKAYIMSRQQAAISNFLGMNEQGINDKVNDVLQGNLREIVSDMTVDQILTNRKQIEFNTKDHTPSPIMAALSFLFSKEMLYVKYASNDIAAYEDPLMLRKCGFYRCKAGHFTEGFGLRGYEAAEEACRMWGYTLSDYVSEGVVNGKYRVFWHKHKA